MGKSIKLGGISLPNPVSAATNWQAGIQGLYDPKGAYSTLNNADKEAELAKQGLQLGPNGPMPMAPGYESMRDDAGGLKSQYKFDPNQSEAFGQLRSQAMSKDPSAWAQLQTKRQGLEEAGQRDMAMKQSSQAMNQGNAMLARTGGLSSGAAGLNARAGARNMMLANQDISRGGMLARLGIGQQDEDRRQGLLGQVADTEMGAQQTNLNALTGDVQQKREFDLNRYGSQMQAWGANNTANAQAAAAAQTRKGKK